MICFINLRTAKSAVSSKMNILPRIPPNPQLQKAYKDDLMPSVAEWKFYNPQWLWAGNKTLSTSMCRKKYLEILIISHLFFSFLPCSPSASSSVSVEEIVLLAQTWGGRIPKSKQTNKSLLYIINTLFRIKREMLGEC